MMKSEMKPKIVILFFSFVAFCILSPVSKAENIVAEYPNKGQVLSESGSLLLNEAQPDPVKHAENEPVLVQKDDSNSKKKDLKDEKISVETVKETTNTGFRSIMPDSFDISGSTGISALLFVSSLLVVFFIMYRACR